MKKECGRKLAGIAAMGVILLLVVGASACSNGNGETVDLLKDPKFGLAHLNDEFHTIKATLEDPKSGLAHANDELHTVKQLLADLTEQVASLEAKAQ